MTAIATTTNNTDTDTDTDTDFTTDDRPSIRRSAVLSGLAAAVAVTGVAAAALALDVPLAVEGEQIPLLGFAQVTLMSTVIGAVLAVVFNRKASNPRRTFVVATVVLTVLSFASPFAVPTDAATRVVLELTHVVAAAIVIPALAASLRAR